MSPSSTCAPVYFLFPSQLLSFSISEVNSQGVILDNTLLFRAYINNIHRVAYWLSSMLATPISTELVTSWIDDYNRLLFGWPDKSIHKLKTGSKFFFPIDLIFYTSTLTSALLSATGSAVSAGTLCHRTSNTTKNTPFQTGIISLTC